MCRNKKQSQLLKDERKKIAKNQKKKQKGKRKYNSIILLYFLPFCIMIAFIYDGFTMTSIFQRNAHNLKIMKKVVSIILSLIGLAFGILTEKDIPAYGDNIDEWILNSLKEIGRGLINNAISVTCFVFTAIILTSSAFAATHPTGRLCAFVKESFKIDVQFHVDFKAGLKAAFKNYSHYKGSVTSETNTDSSSQPIEETINEDSDDTNVSKIDENWTSNHSAYEIELSKRLKLTNEQREVELFLADNIENCIYFNEPGFEIVDWNNQNEINAIVIKKINSLRMYDMKNEFDDDDAAPQTMKNEIAAVSEKDKTVSSLTEKLGIVRIRDNAYKQFPKYTLAELIAEDYNACGLSTFYNGGKGITAKYYFGTSIFWFMELLKYEEISSGTIKSILISIAQRYDDIYYILNDEKADKLAIAFREAASHYNEDFDMTAN